MDSPNPKCILNLVPLSGRPPDFLQIVQVSLLYRETSLYSTSMGQQFLQSFTSGKEYKKFIFLHQLPGPHQEAHWYLSAAFAEWGWLPGLALNPSFKDCSYSSG